MDKVSMKINATNIKDNIKKIRKMAMENLSGNLVIFIEDTS